MNEYEHENKSTDRYELRLATVVLIGGLCTLVAACAALPVIHSVEPALGTAAGGDEVVVSGAGFVAGMVLMLGDAPAEIVAVEADTIFALTPAAIAGTVDVVVMSADGEETTLPESYRYEPTEARFREVPGSMPAIPDDVRGRGAVAVDIDGDGDLDVVQSRRLASPRILVNDNGVLRDETAASMPPALEKIHEDTMDVAVGDIDGDGNLDLVTANIGAVGERNRAYRGDGGSPPRFTDVTALWMPTVAARSTDVELADVDGDGDLDLLVADWKTGETEDAVRGVHLLTNDGTGRFTLDTDRLPWIDIGVFGLALGDFDADGDIDVFAAAVNADPVLLLNDGAGTFSQAPPSWLPPLDIGAKRPATGDVDGDGHLDLYLTNATDADRLLLNDGSGRFDDFSIELLPADPGLSRHAALADLDLDGDLDLVVGRFGTGPETLYRNDGSGRMFDYSSHLPGDAEYGGDVFVVGDFDNDGAPDLFLSVENGPGVLMLQEIPGRDDDSGPNLDLAPPRPLEGSW